MKISPVAYAVFILLGGLATQVPMGAQEGADRRPPNAPKQAPAFPGQTRAPERKLNVAFNVVPVVEGLRNPWGMTFLPSGAMLVTERVGYLRYVGANGTLAPQAVGGLPASRIEQNQ